MLHLGRVFQKLTVHWYTVQKIVMPMCNLLEQSQKFSVTSGSLSDYYRDEIDDVNNNASDGKSFNYKTKIVKEKNQKDLTSSTNFQR